MNSILPDEIIFEDNTIVVQEYLRSTLEKQKYLTGFCLVVTAFRDDHIRPDQYYREWLPKYIETDFYRLFRLSKQSFIKLLEEVSKYVTPKHYHGGNIPVEIEKALLVTLWFLAKGETLRSIGDKFNMSDSAVMTAIDFYVDVIVDNLFKKYIVWPTEEECRVIAEEFSQRNNYPGVIGAIDGCHINCKVPEDQHVSYLNRKQTHSIILQGICTFNCIFTNVYAGFPGSAHDSRVLRNSSLYKDIEIFGPNKYFYDQYHLVGDSAYFLRTWLITPYMDNGRLTREEKRHNYLHSSTRVVIENAFSRIKGRWRILNFVNVYSIKKVVKIVVACCTLHNFTYLLNDTWPEVEIEDLGNDEGNDNYYEQNRNSEYRQGLTKREEIRTYLMNL